MADDAGNKPDPARVWDLAASRRAKEADPEGSEARFRAWKKENAEAIASFRAYVREHGTLADDLSLW